MSTKGSNLVAPGEAAKVWKRRFSAIRSARIEVLVSTPSAVRFTEDSVDAPTPPVNLYNQKSHVVSSALRPQCAVLELR